MGGEMTGQEVPDAGYTPASRRLAMQGELDAVRRQLEEERRANEGLKQSRDEWLAQMERTLRESQDTLSRVHSRNLNLQRENQVLSTRAAALSSSTPRTRPSLPPPP
eukprot:Hpha_TRINITY_DN18503_c0_g1::TRINITY_DN18503_c0_g1_i1::g.195180::m.195180